MKTDKVSIIDVAAAAGVSRSTVSYVLSNKRSISAEVRKRVLEQIEALGYRPHAVARNLALKKTHTIGLYCPSDASKNDLFFLKMLNGVMDSLGQDGFKLLLINVIQESKNYSIPIDHSFPIDGAIVTNTRNSETFLTELQKDDVPFVLIGKPPKHVTVHHIDNDNVLASYQATESYIRENKRRIALIIGYSEEATVYTDYLSGYIKALSDYQIPFNENYVIRLRKNQPDSVEKALNQLLALDAEALILNVPISQSAIMTNRILYDPDKANAIKLTVFGLDVLNDFFQMAHVNLQIIRSNAYQLGFDAGKLIIDLVERRAKLEGHLVRLYPPSMEG